MSNISLTHWSILDWLLFNCLLCEPYITHWGQNKMAATLQMTIFKCISLNENGRTFSNFSLKFIPMGLINNILKLVQIMAWHRAGTWPNLLTQSLYNTWIQRVKNTLQLTSGVFCLNYIYITCIVPKWAGLRMDSSGSNTGIFWEKWVNTVVVDALVTWRTRTSADTKANVDDKTGPYPIKGQYLNYLCHISVKKW